MRKNIELNKIQHYEGSTIGFAEGKISNKEFVASWYDKKTIGGIYYDDWQDTSEQDNKLIADNVFKGKKRNE